MARTNPGAAALKTAGSAPPPSRKRKNSVAEILLMKHLEELGLDYEREVPFHPERNWRFDFALVTGMEGEIAIEIEGGNYGTYDRVGRFQRGTQGGHHRPAGFEKDMRKYNEAAKLGWTVIRFTPNMIIRGESKVFLQELFGSKP